MKKTLILFAAAVACLIAAPANAARQKTVTGSGNIVTEIRNVEAFHAVEAGSIARVFVGDYPAGRVTVKADDNLLAYVKTRVDNGKLKIGFTDVSVRNAKLTVYVPASGITRLETGGTATLLLETPLEGVTLLKTSGASKLAAKSSLMGSNVAIESSGTSRITVESMLGTVSRIISGGTSAIDLKGEPAGSDATIESNGTSRITVESMLGSVSRITSGGASKIYLTGDLKGRNISIRASGTSGITAESPLVCDNVTVENNGTARITIRVKCTDCQIKTGGTAKMKASLDVTRLYIQSTGAAGMTLSGTATSCRIDAGGTSRIDATELKAEQWETTIEKPSTLKR